MRKKWQVKARALCCGGDGRRTLWPMEFEIYRVMRELTSLSGLCGVTICIIRFSETSIAFESPTHPTYKRFSTGRYKAQTTVVPATRPWKKQKFNFSFLLAEKIVQARRAKLTNFFDFSINFSSVLRNASRNALAGELGYQLLAAISQCKCDTLYAAASVPPCPSNIA